MRSPGRACSDPHAQRGDGSVAIFWKGRPATVLTGQAGRELPRGREARAEELQLLMAKATGNFKRGNERRRR